LVRRVLPAVTLIGASGGLLAAHDRPSGEIDVATAGPPIAATPTSTAPTVVQTTIASAPTPSSDPTVDQSNVQSTVAATVATTVPAAPQVATECGGAVLGPIVDTKFGPVQVQASVSSTGYVCSAQGVLWPTEDRKSVSINNQAIPLLDQWSAYQHDASFNSISGATYTSRAYKQSLQAVIDQVVAGG